MSARVIVRPAYMPPEEWDEICSESRGNDLPNPDAIPRLTPGSHEWKAARAAGWGGSPDDEPRDWSGYDEHGTDRTPGMDYDYYLRGGGDLA